MSKMLFFILALLSWQAAYSQLDTIDFKRDFRYEMAKSTQPLSIDGDLSDATWQKATTSSNFWQKLPYYAPAADPKTEIKLSFDDKNLYIAAKCYQKSEIIVQSLQRDEFWDNDGIAVVLDPMNTRSNSVLFGLTAYGAQWDATRSQANDTSSDWNNKWYGETQIHPEYWTAEFAIPLRILRYNHKLDEWGLNFVRGLQAENEFHNWTAVPEGFWPPNSAFAGTLKWEEPPQRTKGNYNLIPYLVGSANKVAGQKTELNSDVGLDAKVAVGSALNLDLTINPDFSQAEADELVTNLTRFNIFLPERRNFFLENADQFGGFGNGATRPFFSRRIGLDQNLQAVPILYGARLTGNLTPTTKIGALNVHSQGSPLSPAQNQSAFSINKQFGRSFIQGMFLNRQAFEGTESIKQDYGRNLSIESLYSNDKGTISLWGAAHFSFKPQISENTAFYNTGFLYTSSNWEILSDFNMVQENYFTDMGYVNRVENYDASKDTLIRVGYNSSYTSIDYRIRPRGGKIASHRFGAEHLMVFNPDWSFNEQYNRLRYFLSLRNTTEIQVRLNYNRFDLLFPFTFTGAAPLPSQQYKTVDLNLQYESDERKLFGYELELQTGGFFNGTLTTVEAVIKYRVQPWGQFGVGYEWNKLDFPDPYGQANINRLISRIEIGFSRNLYWTTLFQYVDQQDFMGINTRLQWRFSPMSDLFLVYVDNYNVLDTASMGTQLNSANRAIILKANYWY